MLRLAQIALWTARSVERFAQAVPLMLELVRAAKRDATTRALLRQVYAYLLEVLEDVDKRAVYDNLVEIAGPEGREDVVTAAENLRNEGRIEALRMALDKALTVRRVVLSDVGRARLHGCTDPQQLERWYERALTAGKEADIFAEANSA